MNHAPPRAVSASARATTAPLAPHPNSYKVPLVLTHALVQLTHQLMVLHATNVQQDAHHVQTIPCAHNVRSDNSLIPTPICVLHAIPTVSHVIHHPLHAPHVPPISPSIRITHVNQTVHPPTSRIRMVYALHVIQCAQSV